VNPLYRAFVLLALASGCQSKGGQTAAPTPGSSAASPHRDEPEHEALPTHVRLSEAVIARAGIKTTAVSRLALQPTLSLPGEITTDPDRTASVASPVAGRIERVDFKEGSAVKKGDGLLVIRVAELGKLRAALATASAKAKAARLNADRLRALVEKRLASDQDAVNADAEASALEIEARGDAEQLAALGGGASGGGLSQLVLRAPVSGIVVSRNAIIGQPVTSEQTVATIADLSELWFMGRVFEKDLGRLALGGKAVVGLNAYPDERFEGTVEYLGQEVDPVARTITARIRLTNRGGLLRIHLFGNAEVALSKPGNRLPSLVVPSDSIAEFAGKTVVFVRQGDGDFEAHDVVLGESALGLVEVLSGLREGERVVSSGTFSLKSTVLKGTLAEDE
jgi:cobalt-zinc-cadmium efflux system membrane fusion protein